MDDHLLIYPNKQQKGHSNNGYGVLKNLMIPGLSVNTQSHNVEMMGMQASLYINGQECDSKEIQMIRPRDIEKIEFYDAPSGKYAKDKIAFLGMSLIECQSANLFKDSQIVSCCINCKTLSLRTYS